MFSPQVDLVTGLAIEEACYAQVCNMVTDPESVYSTAILRGRAIWVRELLLRFYRDALPCGGDIYGSMAVPGVLSLLSPQKKKNVWLDTHPQKHKPLSRCMFSIKALPQSAS